MLLLCCCVAVVLLLLLFCCSSVDDEDDEDENIGDDDLCFPQQTDTIDSHVFVEYKRLCTHYTAGLTSADRRLLVFLVPPSLAFCSHFNSFFIALSAWLIQGFFVLKLISNADMASIFQGDLCTRQTE